MTNQTEPRKNKKLIIAGLVALVVVGLFVAKLVVESKIKAWATEDINLYDPLLKLESATVEASWFSSSVTYKNVVYSLPDAPKLKIVIDQMTEEGIDGDTLMGKPGDITTIDKITMTGFRMIVEELEQPLMEMGGYEVTDMAIPYRDMRAALMANKGNEDIMGIFKAMMPTLQNSTMKSGPGSARDIKMNMRQLELFDLYLGLVTSSGFKELDKAAESFDAALDSAAYKNIKLTGDLFDGSEWLATLDSVEIKGLKYNYKEIVAAFSEFDERTDPITILLEIMPSLYNYKFDGISADKLTVNAAGGLFTINKMQMGPRTLKEQGPNIISDIKLAMGGMDVFSLQAIGLDKMILSDTVVDFINHPGDYVNNRELIEKYSANPLLAVKGTAINNLYIKNLDAKGLVKLDNWSSNVTVDDNLKINSRLSKLYVSNIGLRQAGMFLMNADRTMQDVIGVLAMNPAGLTMDSGFDIDMDIAPDSIGYNVGFDLAAQDQGKLNFRVDGMTGKPRYRYETYGPPLLGSMDISVEDKGVLNNVFKYLSMQGLANDANGARNALVQELDAEIPNAKPKEAALMQGIRTFLMQGGTLNVSITPYSPTELDGADFLDDLENLSISVSNSK